MSWYRLRGLLLIHLAFAVVIFSLPPGVYARLWGWLVGLWFFALLWWMAASATRNTIEREKHEAERGRRESAKDGRSK